MSHFDSHLPFKLDTRDPNFRHECLAWAFQTQLEITEIIAGTHRTITNSKDLMKEIDRLLARR